MKFVTKSTGLNIPTSVPIVAPPPDRDFGEIFQDAARLEISAVSMYHAMDDTGDYDPEFNVMDHITDENRQYGPLLARSKNVDDFHRRWTNIQEELAAKSRLEQDGGWGTTAYLAAGILDPINLVPFGGVATKIYKGGNILRGLALGAEAGFAGGVATEALLQASQYTRTAEETALNIAAGTFLGGVLGSGIGAVKSGVEEAAVRSFDRLTEDVVEEMHVATGERPAVFGTSVGAKAAKDLPQEIAEKINESVEADIASGKISEFQAAEETMKRFNDEYKRLAGFKETVPLNVLLNNAKWLKHITPTLRSFTQASGVGREIAGQLMETGMQRAGSEYAEGGVDVPVETMIKLWEGRRYRARMDIREAYYEYRTGKTEMSGVTASMLEEIKGKIGGRNMSPEERMATGLLSPKEFGEEVSKAMRNNDTHAIPTVDKLAKKLRQDVYEPIKELAIEVGYLPEDVAVNPETAASYLNRIWDIDKIQKNSGDFKEKLLADFQEQALEAENRMGKYLQDKEALMNVVRQLRAKKKDIETAVKEGLENTVKKSASDAIDEASAQIDIEDVIPTADDIAKGAGKAGKKAFDRTLRKELMEAVKEAVEGEIEEQTEEFIESAIARLIDEPDELAVMRALKEEISEPMAEAGKGAALDQLLDPAVYKAAEDEAVIAATKAMERSYEAAEKRIQKMLDDPEYLKEMGQKKIVAEAKREAAAEARKAGRAAMKEATKEVDAKLQEAFGKLSDRAKENARDEYFVRIMEEQPEEYTNTVVHRILGTGGIRPPHDLDVGSVPTAGVRPGEFRRRSLIVRDDAYQEFLVNDPDELITRLIEHTAPHLELRRAFGSSNFAETNVYKDLVEDWEKIAVRKGLMNEGEVLEIDEQHGVFSVMAKKWKRKKERGKAFAEFSQEMEQSISDLSAVFERLKGTYKVPENPSAALNRISLGLRQTNFMRMMGGVVISSIPDLARPLMTHGIPKAWGSIMMPLLRDAGNLKLRSRDLHRFNVVTDMIDNTRSNRISDISDPSPRRSRGESMITTASDTFGYVSGIAKWNDMLKTYAGLVSHDQIIDVVQKWVKHMENPGAPKPTKKEIGFLKDNFIDAGVARDIWSQLNKHGTKHKDGFWLSNIDEWDMVPGNRFRAALSREIDRTIVTPGQDIPLMASTPIGKLIFQFKSFQFAATEKMLLAGLQQNDINFYLGVLTAITFGSLAYIAKEKVAGKEPTYEPKKLVAEGIDRSGIMGWLMEPNNMLEKASNGHIGLGPQVVGEKLSRYQSRNEAAALLGPSFGTVQQLFELMGYGADFSFTGQAPNDRQQQAMQRLLPYSNLFYLRLLLESTSD